MSNTIKKISARGFTLIELLVVIAIIGLLSTIIAAPIQSARKKARDAKKIAELKSTQLAFEQYAESNSAQYPHTLQALSPQFMPLLPTFAASTTSNPRDAFVYTYYDASATGAATSTFSYHFGVKLEVYGPALETDRDCIAATLSNSLSVPFCAVYNGDAMWGVKVDTGSQITASTTAFSAAGAGAGGSDFVSRIYTNFPAGLSFMTEESSSTCVVSNDCIFDVTSQQ